VLDQGADGVMVPHVDRAEQAERLVRAAWYPPRGQRGVSRTVRAHDYGLRPLDGRPAPILIAQIETLDAVDEATAIAGVDGIDVLFVGPADLQHDLAVRQPAAGSGFEDCLDRVVAAARAAGKAAGILVREPGDLPRRVEQGFSFVAVESDLAILRNAFRGLADLGQSRQR
jgi:2-dehydro-3-deoxyglucarate aldolase/4-hydroxy-2-oxoheptanedioate aldolase